MTDPAEIARTRQGLYRFLGGALLPPSVASFNTLAQALPVLNDRDIDVFSFGRDWRRVGEHFPVDIAAAGLDVDYVRLFASGMSGALSPPTESYYRVPTKGGGIAEFVAELQREYRTFGIVSLPGGESPDHISTELEVMAYLCSLEADAWAEQQTRLAADVLALESRFLRHHLTVWVPLFRERVLDAGSSSFYVDAVNAVHAFVIHDRDYVHLIREGMAK